MAKVHWSACYREISDPAKLTAYGQLAGPAIDSGGGRFLARATAARAYDDGKTGVPWSSSSIGSNRRSRLTIAAHIKPRLQHGPATLYATCESCLESEGHDGRFRPAQRARRRRASPLRFGRLASAQPMARQV